ncbi:MAG: Fic family protein [Planctomycetaceae bacterium]|jgi:Fic family protein|nr:Fic family protein [Planctomycetaceae bacterium]
MNKLLTYLKEEKEAKRKGGLYHKTQVNLAYNSNKIEGGKLTEEQTRSIFETRSIGFKEQEAVLVDDIIETSNHFVAFDYLLDTIDTPFSNAIIKTFHRILKTSTSDAVKEWFNVGEWKKLPNEVSGTKTALPQNVETDMNKLNKWYHSLSKIEFENIIEYHYRFEKIHPFQDGNGRVGRLILFRECLKNNIIPFIIDDNHKQFYYRGLKEFANIRGYLIDTCLSAQDTYKEWTKYFYGDLLNDTQQDQ